MASDGEAETLHVRDADAGVTTNNMQVRVRRRPGAEVDAKAIRAGLGLSQPAFADAFGLKLAVLRDWEQGRTKPEGAARVLLQVIVANPDMVREVVEAGSKTPAA